MAQKQHRVAKVYLKHFSQSTSKPWLVATMDKMDGALAGGMARPWPITQEDIALLTVTDGEFDLGNVDPKDKGKLETFFSRVENEYVSIIKTIRNRQLHDARREYLAAFVATLIVRSRVFRGWMSFELAKPTVAGFMRMLHMYMPDEEQKARTAAIGAFDPEDRLNHATYSIWHHLDTRLRDKSFNMVLIENSERGWETCDDPVILRNFIGKGGSLLGKATEIFFPLCDEWCLFMYDAKCRYQMNPLRRHPHKSFVKADDWTRFLVRERVFENAWQHIFFSRPDQHNDHKVQ